MIYDSGNEKMGASLISWLEDDNDQSVNNNIYARKMHVTRLMMSPTRNLDLNVTRCPRCYQDISAAPKAWYWS